MKPELIVFDLDGTLAPSKSEMDSEMSDLLCRLLSRYYVAVISGGSYTQFERQFLTSFSCAADPGTLFLQPTSGAMMYVFDGTQWVQTYAKTLSREQKKRIREAFEVAYRETGYAPSDLADGEIIEDRETQMTFSALGQKAPLSEKEVWDPDMAKRRRIKAVLDPILSDEFEVSIGGTTSIDVTQKGITKAFGIRTLSETLGIPEEKMLFVGDALEEGGNDAAVLETDAETHAVESVDDTKAIIRTLIEKA